MYLVEMYKFINWDEETNNTTIDWEIFLANFKDSSHFLNRHSFLWSNAFFKKIIAKSSLFWGEKLKIL